MIRDFLVFEIRKNLDLRKILVTPKIFLKSRFHCILRSDYEQINNKSILPVKKVYYGPLEFEIDQMKIVVGSLICQPDPQNQKGIEDRIENIEFIQNTAQDIMSNHSKKLDYMEDILDDHSEENLMFHEMLKNYTETHIDIQVEIEEEQPAAYQG